MQARPALACVLGAIFGAVVLGAVPREASTAAAPGRRLSRELAARAATRPCGPRPFRVAVCFWGVHLCARLSCHDSCVRSLNLIFAQA